MIEVLKQALDAFHQIFESTPVYHNDGTCIINDKSVELSNKAIASLQQAIAELESEKPVAWLLTEKNINSLQVDSIQLLIDRLKHAHHTDLCVRINGQDECFQADWLKHMVRATPPQRTEQNFCPRCGKRTNDIHTCTPPQGIYYTPPQRTWVGLTDEEIKTICLENGWDSSWQSLRFAQAIEAKLKERNI